MPFPTYFPCNVILSIIHFRSISRIFFLVTNGVLTFFLEEFGVEENWTKGKNENIRVFSCNGYYIASEYRNVSLSCCLAVSNQFDSIFYAFFHLHSVNLASAPKTSHRFQQPSCRSCVPVFYNSTLYYLLRYELEWQFLTNLRKSPTFTTS